jgi:hypothetical protein
VSGCCQQVVLLWLSRPDLSYVVYRLWIGSAQPSLLGCSVVAYQQCCGRFVVGTQGLESLPAAIGTVCFYGCWCSISIRMYPIAVVFCVCRYSAALTRSTTQTCLDTSSFMCVRWREQGPGGRRGGAGRGSIQGEGRWEGDLSPQGIVALFRLCSADDRISTVK